MIKELIGKIKNKSVKHVPTILQMEAVECGSASLAMIMAYHKKYIPLEELRIECGISRDGSKASNMIRAAKKYGFDSHGYRKEPEELIWFNAPMIIHWNFNHFVVFEGFKGKYAYINDPGFGEKKITLEEFNEAFTGVVLTFEKTDRFKKGGQKQSIVASLLNRLKGTETSLLFVILIGLMLVIPGLVVPVFSKIFVDEILLKSMKDWLSPLLIAMSITLIIRGILLWLQGYYLLKLETKLAVSGSSKFLWHLLKLPIDFFSQRYSGEIQSRVDINDTVATLLSGKLVSTFLDAIMVVFYLFLLFQYDIFLTLIGILTAIFNIIYLKYSSKKIINGNIRLSLDRGKMIGVAMVGLQIIESLKANGNESDFFKKWSGHLAKLMNSEQELGEISSALQTIPILLSGINTALILLIGGFRVIDGFMTIGMLVAFTVLMSSFLDPVSRLVDMGVIIQQVKGDINKLEDVFNYAEEKNVEDVVEDVKEDKNDELKLMGYVELKDVSFGYNKLEPPLIQDFNLKLTPGRRVALVGSSGSGKSTVSKIIAGLYEPWSGEIYFDNKKRDEIQKKILNNSVAMVDQDIAMFEGSVKNNLTLWDSTVLKTEIINASKDAQIHDDISARKNGYEHFMEEDGKNFSGGQRQRLEISRALVGNPRILILDEATSALDPKTEKEVDLNIRKRGCTCIIVAHRLSTIRDCDEIIVLDRGKIVQRGTHDELINCEGVYKELIKTC